jgi:hypothetical protein
MQEEHILDACYIMEIHQLTLNLFGHHTIISQAVHPLADQAQVDTKFLLPNCDNKRLQR